jgi:hypothetical protein
MKPAHRILQTSAAALFLLCNGLAARAQNTPEMREILERLERLEKDNQTLMQQVRQLREELANARPETPVPAATEATSPPSPGTAAAPAPSTADSVAVQQSRIDELAETKVEASQKFPIRITGMALFNGFLNGASNGSSDNPLTASMYPGSDKGGGSLRQSIIGLQFDGPTTLGGGKVSGAISMDFFGGSASSLGHTVRLRTATLKIDWKNTTIAVGQDKPIISPRDPDSLAQVAFSPLTGAGNLWLWQPQIRLEQRMTIDENDGLRLQVGAFQTSSPGVTAGPYDPYAADVPAGATEASTPGVEGRLEYWRRWSEHGRLELAGGIHANRNHFGAYDVPTNVYSFDWLFRPIRFVEFTGMFFHGRNVATLGALAQGFTIFPNGSAVSVASTGGWAQVRFPITARLAFNIYGGQQDDRNSDLLPNMIGKNQGYFSNIMYRWAPNVIVSLEAGQVRTTYLGLGNRLNDHYDLALAYLF